MNRKSFVVVALLLMGFSLAASAQLKFGVRAGLGFPNQTGKSEKLLGGGTVTYSTARAFGFHAGVLALYQIPMGFGGLEIEGDLQFAKLGGKAKEAMIDLVKTLKEGKEVAYKPVESLYYLQIPLRANFTFDLGPVNLLAGVGPQFGFGLFGSYKMGDQKTDIKFGKDEYYSVMDISLSMHAGVRLGALPLQATFFYDLGLMDIDSSDISSVKNHNLGVSLAFLF